MLPKLSNNWMKILTADWQESNNNINSCSHFLELSGGFTKKWEPTFFVKPPVNPKCGNKIIILEYFEAKYFYFLRFPFFFRYLKYNRKWFTREKIKTFDITYIFFIFSSIWFFVLILKCVDFFFTDVCRRSYILYKTYLPVDYIIFSKTFVSPMANL